LKQQVSKQAKYTKLRLCSKINGCYIVVTLHFLPDMPKLELLTFATY